MVQILYGKPVAEKLDDISSEAFQKYSKEGKKPHMTAITVGDNPASLLYVSRKEQKAKELGVEFHWIKLDDNTTQETLQDIVIENSKKTNGLIIQLPLPEHLNQEEAINCIPYQIDIDGLTTHCLLYTSDAADE